jgi:iron complex transport system permease protein
MLFWTMGSLKDRSLADVWAIVPFMGIGSLILWRTGNSLALLTLGYDIAKNMGVDFRRLQWMIVFGVALCVGSAVALTGTIAFVGLVVPHVLRPFVGYHPGRLLLASGIGGSMFTMLADLMVQVLPTQPELHIGVLTALLGGPMFFALALKAGRQS